VSGIEAHQSNFNGDKTYDNRTEEYMGSGELLIEKGTTGSQPQVIYWVWTGRHCN